MEDDCSSCAAVVRTLGTVKPKHTRWLAQTPGKVDANGQRKCALLGTCKIMNMFLKLPGFW